MKFTIERAVLAKALQDLNAVVDTSAKSIPITQNILIEAEADLIRFTTTNLDMWASTEIPMLVVEQPGRITGDMSKLREIVGVIPDGADIAVSMEVAPDRLRLIAGRSRFAVATLPADDFPRITHDIADSAADLSAAAVLAILERVSFCMGDKTRHYLHGVHLHTPNGKLRAVATDGKVAAYDETDAPEGFDLGAGLIIPARAVGVLESILGRAPEGAVLSVSISETTAQFHAAGTTFLTKLIDGEFPEYMRIFNVDTPNSAEVDVPGLETCLRRVRIFSPDANRTSWWYFTPGNLHLVGRNTLAEIVEDDLGIDGVFAETTVRLSSTQMLNILSRIPSETATISFSEPMSPLLVNPNGDHACRFIVMPFPV